MDSRLTTVLLVVVVAVGAYFLFLRPHNTPSAIPFTVAEPPPAATRASEETHWIDTDSMSVQVSTHSGAVRAVRLTAPQFRSARDHRPLDLVSMTFESAFPLRSDVSFHRGDRNVLPAYLTFAVDRLEGNRIELVARPEGTDVEIRRVIRAQSAYGLAVRTTVTNHGAPGRVGHSEGVYHWVRRQDETGGFFRQPWQRSEVLCSHHAGTLHRESREDLGKVGTRGFHSASFVGAGNLYFLTALAVTDAQHPDCVMRSEDRGLSSDPTGSLLHALLVWPTSELGTEQSADYGTVAYIGPKFRATLEAASPVLRDSMSLGFFALIARGLLRALQFLYSLVRNWGVAIMLLTVCVRVALFPILSRSIKSMAMMQKLKPEIDAINAKYADNTEQKGLATMELYRKHNVNILGGCLPQFAQLPVWWALYTTLQSSVELYHAPFALWWRDLSAPDPYYVLPLVLGAVMFLQQKVMPVSMPDPVQQKVMMYFMPIFLTGISLFLPAGLALYMLVNSVLAIGQQKLTKMQIDRLAGAPASPAIEVRPVIATTAADNDRTRNRRNGGSRGGR